jgi:chromosome segregation ATPase
MPPKTFADLEAEAIGFNQELSQFGQDTRKATRGLEARGYRAGTGKLAQLLTDHDQKLSGLENDCAGLVEKSSALTKRGQQLDVALSQKNHQLRRTGEADVNKTLVDKICRNFGITPGLLEAVRDQIPSLGVPVDLQNAINSVAEGRKTLQDFCKEQVALLERLDTLESNIETIRHDVAASSIQVKESLNDMQRENSSAKNRVQELEESLKFANHELQKERETAAELKKTAEACD